MADKKKFSLAEQIGVAVGSTSIAAMDANAKIAADVSKSDREQIVYLPRTALVADEKNFYSMDGIEELAKNIETVGLLEPLRVRQIEGEDGLYRIVSGHRRRAALDWLALHGNDLGDVACIIEKTDGVSPALAELRLIFANSDTRRMSGADISKQAERVEALLYQLKEEGFEFSGRMRDHVAEACKVSATKLANLKVIRENLIPELHQMWEAGELNDSKALRFAQESEAVQERATEILTAPQIAEFTESAIDRLCRQAVNDVQRKDGVKSTPKPDAPQRDDAYFERMSEENELFALAVHNSLLKEFVETLSTAETRKDGIENLKDAFGRLYRDSWGGDVGYNATPKGLEVDIKGNPRFSKSWADVWEALAVEALQVVGKGRVKRKQDDLVSLAAPATDAAPQWRTGEPEREGLYIVQDKFGDYEVLFWRAGEWWAFEEASHPYYEGKDHTKKWFPLPEDEP